MEWRLKIRNMGFSDVYLYLCNINVQTMQKLGRGWSWCRCCLECISTHIDITSSSLVFPTFSYKKHFVHSFLLMLHIFLNIVEKKKRKLKGKAWHGITCNYVRYIFRKHGIENLTHGVRVGVVSYFFGTFIDLLTLLFPSFWLLFWLGWAQGSPLFTD